MSLKVSVVIPAINEERGIGKTIDAVKKEFFQNQQWDLEILIVDGNSKDKTREIATSKGAQVLLETRKGYGRAYKTGLAHATGDIIVTGDADATYPFDIIHEYIQMLIDEHLDFMTTDRFAALKHGSMSLKHRFGNLTLAWTLRILFLVNIRDSQSGMWIFKRDALTKIQPLEAFNNGMPFSEEIKIEMFTTKHIEAKEIPSTLSAREGQVKLESFKDGIKNLKFLFKKRLTPS
ncbi:MAG TPA: glycosyltransferase family 2 protein [Candidatus Thermoplasmatota archaeon]|nr:glycosyltransferase family 2 protein [Candidatus Thermoplasmatota archaeon]